MAKKIPIKNYMTALKALVTKYQTFYSNVYPYNCFYITKTGAKGTDCIGLWKNYINDPSAYKKTKPAGWYVQPGQVCPDGYGGIELLEECCSDIAWYKFTNMVQGEYLYFDDPEYGWHAGVYVKDLFGKNSKYNCVEATCGWGANGVIASWIDVKTGARRQYKGGPQIGSWVAHGKMTRFFEYPPVKKKSITTIAKEVIAGKWGNYPERKELLENAGYDYNKVQKKVNALVKKGK